jgi:hypothetical protein
MGHVIFLAFTWLLFWHGLTRPGKVFSDQEHSPSYQLTIVLLPNECSTDGLCFLWNRRMLLHRTYYLSHHLTVRRKEEVVGRQNV